MSSLAYKIPPSIDRDALLRILEPVVHGQGAEIVDIEFRPERGGWVLRLYVEKAGASAQALSTRDAAVSLELCANVSRDLSPALDLVDIIPHAYQLEVSSPGVERPLRTERDFVRFAGQRVRLKRRVDEGVGSTEDRVVNGLLSGVVGGNVQVVEGKRTHEIPLDTIESARLVFEFGASGKEHSRSKARPSRDRADNKAVGTTGGQSPSGSTGGAQSRSQRKH